MKKILVALLVFALVIPSMAFADNIQPVGFSFNSDSYFATDVAQQSGNDKTIGESGFRSLNADEGKMDFGSGNDAWFKVEDGKLYLGGSYCAYTDGSTWRATSNVDYCDVGALVLNQSSQYLAGSQEISFEAYKDHNIVTMGVRFMVHNSGKNYYAIVLGGTGAKDSNGGGNIAYVIYKVTNGSSYEILREVPVSDTVSQVGAANHAYVDIKYNAGKIDFNLEAYYGSTLTTSYSDSVTDASPFTPDSATVCFTELANNSPDHYAFFRDIEINSLSSEISNYSDDKLNYEIHKEYVVNTLNSSYAVVTGFATDASSLDIVDGKIYLSIPATVTVEGEMFNVTKIANEAFVGGGAKNVETVDLSQSAITEIGDWAFAEQGYLGAVTLPKTLTKLGGNVFRGDMRLNSVNIPEGVTQINPGTFFNIGLSTQAEYGSKTVITFEGSSVTLIDGDKGAIVADSNTQHIELRVCSKAVKDTLTSYMSKYDSSKYTISEYSLETDKTYSDGILSYDYKVIKSIDSDSVSGATVTGFAATVADHVDESGMLDLVIPAQITDNGVTVDVTAVKDGAFWEAGYLNSVTVDGEKLTSIGNNAFRGQTGLTKVVLPKSLTTIGQEAFKGCEYLGYINIPEGVSEIKYHTFYGIRIYGGSKAQIIIEGACVTINTDAFSGIGIGADFVIYHPDVKSQVDALGIDASKYSVKQALKYDNGVVSFYAPSNEAMKLYVAAYKGDSLKISEVKPFDTVSAGNKYTYTLTINPQSDAYDKVSAFLWNNDCVPLTLACSIK